MKTATQSACDTCAYHSLEGVKKLGVDTTNIDFVIALAGNPNTGKSTVFNALTGLRQHTGNWPGKTVTRAEGAFEYQEKKYKLVDLPGTYSLMSRSEDEEVARNFILFGKPTLTVIVVDASRLERNLNLVLQILEITSNAILCLNLIDEAEKNNIRIDYRSLSKELGIPVIPTSARSKEGIPELISTISDLANKKIVCKPHKIKSIPKHVEEAVKKLSNAIKKQYPNISNSRWLAFRVLEGDEHILEALKTGAFI